jgi:hypothetical protein
VQFQPIAFVLGIVGRLKLSLSTPQASLGAAIKWELLQHGCE